MAIHDHFEKLSKDQTRVLVLHPGHGDDPLKCTLEVASIGGECVYQALSYTWKLDRGNLSDGILSDLEFVREDENPTESLSSRLARMKSVGRDPVDLASTTSHSKRARAPLFMSSWEARYAQIMDVPSNPAVPVSASNSKDEADTSFQLPRAKSPATKAQQLPLDEQFVWPPELRNLLNDVPQEHVNGYSQKPAHKPPLDLALPALPLRIQDTERPAHKENWEGYPLHYINLRGHIWIQGKKVAVQENLELALLQIRDSCDDTSLWVDAICINQTDNEERNDQVRRMGTIFKDAKNVCVWLGPEADNSDKAMALVNRLKNLRSAAQVSGTSHDLTEEERDEEWKAFKTMIFRNGFPVLEDLMQFRALSFLVNRDWFYRRWVFQEVALATDVVVRCGRSICLWNDLACAILFLDRHHERLIASLSKYQPWGRGFSGPNGNGKYGDIKARAGNQFLLKMQDIASSNDENSHSRSHASLTSLVVRLSHLHVSNKLDAVFALLSVAKDAPTAVQLLPDYEKSPQQVYTAFVEHSVRTEKSLDILCQSWAPPCSDKLPSWIRKRLPGGTGLMSAGDPHNLVDTTFVGETRDWKYSAGIVPNRVFELAEPVLSKNSAPQPSNTGGTFLAQHTLKAIGCIVTEIEQIGEKANDGFIPGSWLKLANDEFIPESWFLFASKARQATRQRNKQQRLWYTLIGERMADGSFPSTEYAILCWTLFTSLPDMSKHSINTVGILNALSALDNLWDSPQEYRGMKHYLSKISNFENAYLYVQRLYACTVNRCLITTSDQRLGLVPSNVKYGDLVCILFGCSVPVILRRTGNEFSLIGEAYINGIMDGELMKEPDHGGLAETTFLLV